MLQCSELQKLLAHSSSELLPDGVEVHRPLLEILILYSIHKCRPEGEREREREKHSIGWSVLFPVTELSVHTNKL